MLTRHIFFARREKACIVAISDEFWLMLTFFLYGLVDYKEKNNKNGIVLMLIKPVEWSKEHLIARQRNTKTAMYRNNCMEYKHLYLSVFSLLVLCTQVNMFVMLLWMYIHTGQAWKICLAKVGIEPTTFGILARVQAKGKKGLQTRPGIL
jgi:hypothetical protein